MSGVVKSMDAVMRSMNLEKMGKMLEKFEKQQEDLDVRTAYMDQAMGNSTTSAMPEGQVESLMADVGHPLPLAHATYLLAERGALSTYSASLHYPRWPRSTALR